MIVDKPGSNDHPLSVDDSLGRSAHPSNFCDFAVANSNIAMKGRHTGTVDDATIFD